MPVFTRRRPLIAARLIAAALGLALCSTFAAAAPAADATNGETLARRWCAACHIVGSDQIRGADNAPTFASLARQPGFSAENVAKFLMDPHPRMPDMQLGRGEATDLGAYIASLAR